MLFYIILASFFFNLIIADSECPYLYTSGDRRDNKNKLRLVQYNVEWLFIDYYSPINCPGSGCTWINQSEAETHMDYVAKVVNDLNPDIINFCEIEGCDELNMLKNKINTTYNTYLKKGTDTSTGQNVGMLTKIDPLIDLYRSDIKYNYPVDGSNCGYSGSTGSSGVSKHYITEFQFSGSNIAFIAVHLLAIPTDSTRCVEREAQASVLQNIILGYIDKGYDVIVLGDFNDYDSEVLDINNNKPISRVLDILKGYQGGLAGHYTLYNIAAAIPQKERYSDWWNSDGNCKTSSQSDFSMIDHILVTKNIQDKIDDVFIYHGYDEFCGKYNSDHFPVVVDFKL